jgi:hypothetical protein
VSDYVTHRKTADEMFEHYFCRVPHWSITIPGD